MEPAADSALAGQGSAERKVVHLTKRLASARPADSVAAGWVASDPRADSALAGQASAGRKTARLMKRIASRPPADSAPEAPCQTASSRARRRGLTPPALSLVYTWKTFSSRNGLTPLVDRAQRIRCREFAWSWPEESKHCAIESFGHLALEPPALSTTPQPGSITQGPMAQSPDDGKGAMRQ